VKDPKKIIYLDNAATTAVRKEVFKEMFPFFSEKYGNPSSIHSVGQEALRAVEKARLKVATVLGVDAKEIYFTGSTTEADNIALWGVIKASGLAKPHLIISPLEHHAVLDTARVLEEKDNIELTILAVDKYGLVDPKEVKASIKENTVLVSVMFAANEIGTIQPVGEISAITKQAGVLFHTDAAAAAEYLNLDVEELGVDLMVIGPHKFGGPKGVGILYIREGTKVTPLVYGGSQEKGLRPGTHNVPGIVGAAEALRLAVGGRRAQCRKVEPLAKRLISGLEKIDNAYLTGHPRKRAPHIVSFIFKGAEGEAMVLRLSDRGIMASSGSACTSGSLEPSHVLLACGIPPQEAHGSVRFSLGLETSEEDVDYVIKVMPEVVGELRNMNPLYSSKKNR